MVNENASDRQKIAQQRIENVLRQITTDFKFGPSTTERPDLQMGVTSRINPAITMSASTAFLDDVFNTTESTPQLSPSVASLDVETEKPREDFVYDFDVTVESHNLFEVIAAAVTSYESQAATEIKDIVFTIQQTDNRSEPVIMIQMSEFSNTTIVNVKISNETITPLILKVTPEDFMQFDPVNDDVTFDTTKLANILEDNIMNSEKMEPVELSPEEIAEVLSTLVDVNDEKRMEILISDKTVTAMINGNVFEMMSTEKFPKVEKFSLDLTAMPMEPSDIFLNKEVKELIYQYFINNLRSKDGDVSSNQHPEEDSSHDQFQLELPVFGISISSQNISSNLTDPGLDPGLETDTADEASITTLSSVKSGDNVMLTFPVFGFNITSPGSESETSDKQPVTSQVTSSASSPASKIGNNGAVEWLGNSDLVIAKP